MLKRVSDVSRRYFVAIVLVAALLGYFYPVGFGWVGFSFSLPFFGGVKLLHIGLGLIMFGMGMTLSWESVRRALQHGWWVFLGVSAQFLIMPLVAFLLCLALGLDGVLAAGVILVGCCPGGTASNVIAFLARADVPLSVSITLASTFFAPLATPWLMWFYVQKLMGLYTGEVIEIPVGGLMKTTLLIVGPIVVGLALKQITWGEEPVPRIKRASTMFSILVIALIVGFVITVADLDQNITMAIFLAIPVILHNLTGLGLGYYSGVLFSLPLKSIRSLSIEVGMQNSGLGVALAVVLKQTLEESPGIDPATLSLIAMPSILFSVWHNVSGPVLASIWGRNDH